MESFKQFGVHSSENIHTINVIKKQRKKKVEAFNLRTYYTCKFKKLISSHAALQELNF